MQTRASRRPRPGPGARRGALRVGRRCALRARRRLPRVRAGDGARSPRRPPTPRPRPLPMIRGTRFELLVWRHLRGGDLVRHGQRAVLLPVGRGGLLPAQPSLRCRVVSGPCARRQSGVAPCPATDTPRPPQLKTARANPPIPSALPHPPAPSPQLPGPPHLHRRAVHPVERAAPSEPQRAGPAAGAVHHQRLPAVVCPQPARDPRRAAPGAQRRAVRVPDGAGVPRLGGVLPDGARVRPAVLQ